MTTALSVRCGALFITSFPDSMDLTLTSNGAVVDVLPRHAVWQQTSRKQEVIDTSNDLQALRRTYGIPSERCFILGARDLG